MTDEQIILRARQIFARQQLARDRLAAAGAAARVARLRALKRALIAQRDALRGAMQADFGKHPVEVDFTEIDTVLDEINVVVRHLPDWVRPAPAPSHPLLRGRAEVWFEPKGVVLIIAPWNYPIYLSLMPLVGAVAAGNAVMIRPSERVPHTRTQLGALIAAAFPEDEAAVIDGEIAVAEALLEFPFDHFFFTGSAPVGARVMEAAAKQHAAVTLELGGKSPAIVDASADVARAARRIAWGKFLNAGQTCVAPDYVLVHRSLAEPLRDQLAIAIEAQWRVSSAAHYCRLVDDRGFARVRAMLDEAISRGARVEIGGDADESPRTLVPTVISHVDPGARVMREEIFGPILPLVPFDRFDEAVGFARERGVPLALYVFAGRRETATRWVAAIPSGGAVINHVVVHLANAELPFGGRADSGFGRYHGRHGFLEFSHQRSVVSYGRWSVPDVLAPPYDGWLVKMASKIVGLTG